MTHTFSIQEAFKSGWHLLRAHSGLVFKVVLTMLALQIATSMVEKVLEGTALGFVGSFVLTVASMVVGIGATVITLKLAEHKHTEYADLIPSWSIIWRFLLASLLVALLVGIPLVIGAAIAVVAFFSAGGMIAFSDPSLSYMPTNAVTAAMVPALLAAVAAVYLGLRYMAVRYAIIDGAKVVESLRKSWHMTKGAVPKLLLFGLCAVLLNIAGALLFLVGLLLTIPLTMLAMAHIYLKLKHRA